MNFLKIELTKKRGAIALLATGLIVTSFILGGYVATGNWNPWGNKHYYQNLNVNFGYCVSGSQNFCSSVHNTMYNSGVAWIDQVIQGTTGTVSNGVCFPSATCGMSFIALSGSSVTLSASDVSSGVTNGNCGAAGSEAGTEITAANGLQRAAATTNTLLSGATGSTSVLQKTFTSSATQTVQLACLVSYGTASNANSIQLAAASFTGVTLNSGDTIQITWTLTWSWS
jgi:hypothetical protein